LIKDYVSHGAEQIFVLPPLAADQTLEAYVVTNEYVINYVRNASIRDVAYMLLDNQELSNKVINAIYSENVKTLKDLNVKGKTVLVRVDYNVPLDSNLNITNNKRIRETVDTINYLTGQGAKVVLMSHLGRPDGKVVESMSLKPVAKELSKLLGHEVGFAPDSIGSETKKMVSELKNGDVLLLENLRFYPEEEGKNQSGKKDKEAMLSFAKELASMGDVFVQDAFGVVHRAHASTAGIVRYIKEVGAGFLLEKEITFLGKQLDDRGKDKRKGNKKGEGFVAILGGSKVSDKINIIENLLNKADVIIIGGAMAYTFLKAQGIEIGKSRVENDKLDLARELLQKAKDKGVKILLPIDHITASQSNVDFANQVVLNPENIYETKSNSIDSELMGLDVGPKTNELFETIIKNADTILWNGPLGVFEINEFSKGTIGMAEAIAQSTDKGAMSVVGGGDSVAAVEKAGVEKRITHISTGGGASLEFLEGKVLPGINALKSKYDLLLNALKSRNSLRTQKLDIVNDEKSFENISEYKAIEKYIKTNLQSIRTLFIQDKDKQDNDKRGNKFSKKIDIGNNQSLTFDFSRTNIDENMFSLFVNLFKARNLKNKIEEMFNGKKINWTEGRAVLHSALRNTSNNPVYVEGTDKNVMDDINAVLQKMKSFSDKLISGQWKGVTGKQITDVVSIGIGGSDLGPRMATDALSTYKVGPNVHFVSNVDPNDINSILNSLGLNPETTLFIIESKTFTTEETLSNANLAKKWITSKLGNNADVISKHFVAVSTNKEKVAAFGIDTNNMFEFWDWVGGRYSVWSAVGLPLMCSIGYDNFIEFLDGAHQIDNNFKNSSYENNLPIIMAMLNVLERNFLGRSAYAILPYNKYLKLFTSHIQQVYMESLGKSVDSKGNRINYATGSELYGTAGTDAQHSYLQEHHQGTDIIPVDFVGFATNDIDDKDMQTSHLRLLANLLAQSNAMAFGRTYDETVQKLISEGVDENTAKRKAKDQVFDGNRPSTIMMFDKLTPRSLGALIALYEDMVTTLGIVWDINTFDQMGVELGKVNAKGLFSALQGNQFDTDSSTQNLINSIIQQNKLTLPFVTALLKAIAKPLAIILFYKDYKSGKYSYVRKKYTLEATIAAVLEAPLMMLLSTDYFVLLHYSSRFVHPSYAQAYRTRYQGVDEIKTKTKETFVKTLKISTAILLPIASIAFLASVIIGVASPFIFLIPGIVTPLAITIIASFVTNIKNHIIYNLQNNDNRLSIIDSKLTNAINKLLDSSDDTQLKEDVLRMIEAGFSEDSIEKLLKQYFALRNAEIPLSLYDKKQEIKFGTAGIRGILSEEFNFLDVSIIIQAISNAIN
ncbi:MAG: glucose-6-phosphate isomerase, partial [Endomicrobiaceae bacterium]|nr:glucose-6-phosphate isomerase [Endomicrobiaceae bacterium]